MSVSIGAATGAVRLHELGAGADGFLAFELPPFFKSTSQNNGQIHLSWKIGDETRLQTASRLTTRNVAWTSSNALGRAVFTDAAANQS